MTSAEQLIEHIKGMNQSIKNVMGDGGLRSGELLKLHKCVSDMNVLMLTIYVSMAHERKDREQQFKKLIDAVRKDSAEKIKFIREMKADLEGVNFKDE